MDIIISYLIFIVIVSWLQIETGTQYIIIIIKFKRIFIASIGIEKNWEFRTVLSIQTKQFTKKEKKEKLLF